MRYVAIVDGKPFTLEIEEDRMIVEGQAHTVDLRRIEPLPLYSLLVDNLSYEVFIEPEVDKHIVVLEGKLYTVEVQEERAWQRGISHQVQPIAGGVLAIKAPMPGVVVEVRVVAGQAVRAGEALLVLESMKMENLLYSPQDGIVKSVHVAAHDQVGQGQTLLTLDV